MKRKKHKIQNRTPRQFQGSGQSGTGSGKKRRWALWLTVLGLISVVSGGIYFSTRPPFQHSVPEPGPRSGIPLHGMAGADSNAPGAASGADAIIGSSNWDAIATTHQKDTAAAELAARANALLAGGNGKAAIEIFKRALALTPDDEDLHYDLGIAYGQTGDITNAEHHYREALRLLPDYPEVHNNLGTLLLHVGRLAEADEQFSEAIKLMPELSTAQNNLGIVRQRQNRVPDAIACFRKAIQYNTNYWQAHFNLAIASLSQDDKDEAVAELKTVLRLNPGYEPAERALQETLAQPSP